MRSMKNQLMKKQISRKCIATGKIKNTDELIRIVMTKNQEFFVNSNVKGRGAYVSNDIKLFENIKIQKLLNRSFRTNVPMQTYDELEKQMKGE